MIVYHMSCVYGEKVLKDIVGTTIPILLASGMSGMKCSDGLYMQVSRVHLPQIPVVLCGHLQVLTVQQVYQLN